MYLVVLHGQTVGILHLVPGGAVFEDIVEMLQERCGDYQLAAA
jgi:hypothetical protein